MYSGSFLAEVYATKSDVWIGHIEQVSTSLQINQMNPNVTCLLYRNIRIIWLPGTAEYKESEYNLFILNDWVLRGASGNYVNINNYGYMVDVGNPEYQKWLANWYKANLNSYNLDGAYLDNCFPNYEITYSTSEWPVNPRTGESYQSADFTLDITSLVNTIKDAISPKIVIGNTIMTGVHFFREDLHESFVEFMMSSKIDGIHSECWISSFESSDWYTEEQWKKSIDMAIWIETNFQSKGNVFWTTSENAGLGYPEGEVRLPLGVTKKQYATYCYASRLLTVGQGENWIFLGTYMAEDYSQSLFQINIGTPTGKYHTLSTHIYVRDFSQGMILVNPTSEPYTVTVGEGYTDTTTKNPVSSILAVPPNTGIILTK
jgi:hypothetical protein